MIVIYAGGELTLTSCSLTVVLGSVINRLSASAHNVEMVTLDLQCMSNVVNESVDDALLAEQIWVLVVNVSAIPSVSDFLIQQISLDLPLRHERA